MADQNKGKYPLEPMKTRVKNKKTAQSVDKRGQLSRDWF